MSFSESMRMAFRSLWNHKMRSILTIMGVVIGISSVVAVTSLGAAFEESITGEFGTIDNQLVLVTVNVKDQGVGDGPPQANGGGRVFTQTDVDAISLFANVDDVYYSGEWRLTGFEYDGETIIRDTATATTASNPDVSGETEYAIGGPFQDGANEIVLGWGAASIFTEDPLTLHGETITAVRETGNIDLKVTGILAETDAFFGEINQAMYVPIDPLYTESIKSPTTGQEVLVYEGMAVLVAGAQNVNDVRDEVQEYFDGTRSDAAALIREDLEIIALTIGDITDQIGAAFDQITIFIAGTAGVSLLVGGIMIGTIMLISVTERTKEIGMMKAIGAKDGQVLTMFLLEAATIGFLGTLLGILLGIGAGAGLISALFSGDISFVMPWNWVGIAVIVGVGTGILAGLLPARRAVRIQPVEALNYE